MSASSSASTAAAGGGGDRSLGICCWLCGFPIADMETGIFPNSNKSTGVAKSRRGWWGMGVGEHVLQPAPGTGYVGIFQRSYGLLNKSVEETYEKEFLKKEIRWAHRYCNTIKSTLLFVTRPHGELLKVVEHSIIHAFLTDLWGGHYKENGIDRGYLHNPQFQVASTDEGNSWRNLIHYWIDRTQGKNFKEKLLKWIEYQTIAINIALENLVRDVNYHNNKNPTILNSNYHQRVRDPKNEKLRLYQQQKCYETSPNYCCDTITDDINRPGEQVAHAGLPLVEEDLSNSQEEEENNGEITIDETESKTPPSGGGGGGEHSTPPGLFLHTHSAILAQQRAATVPGSATRISLPISVMGGRTREKYEGVAKCNEQVWALWGDYGGYDKVKIASWMAMYTRSGGAGGGNERKRKTRKRKNRRRSTRKRAQ